MKEIRSHIGKIRSLLSILRSSTEKKDLYNDVKVEVGLMFELPSLDFKTRSLFTFHTMSDAFRCRRTLKAVVPRSEELELFYLSESD